MSYVRHKTRAFRDSGDIPELIRRRSEGRLKTYPSVEDARAWACGSDDRRQQILDYVISDIEECGVGKYVPVDTVINTLLANKNADCGKLANEVDELQRLLDMYSKLELSEDQKRALQGMKADIKKAGESLESMTDKSEVCAAVKREQEGGVPCSALDKYDEQDLKAIIINKDAEIIALKNQLAAMHAECDQHLSSKSQPDRFKEVVKERDSLKKELRNSKHEIQSLRNRLDDPCVKKIEVLENEISRLKSKGQLTQDEETEIIRKEIQVLKKYCAKLAAIEEENQNLKQQLKQGGGGAFVCGSTKDADLSSNIGKRNEAIDEQNRLNARIKKLEKELLKYTNLPEDIDTMRQKCQMLDSVSDECKNLRSSLENMKEVEQEIKTLKKKATNSDLLQSQLDSTNEKIKCLSHCAKEAEDFRRERDILRSKLCSTETQYRQLQDKVKYLENIKCEREMYKMKYEQLLGLECDCEMLKAQVNKFKSIDKDRDSLVKQVKECECCIADQEEEIKKLIYHIENMNKSNNQQQTRMQKEINKIRNELNQKNNLIIMSEQKLSSVQEHLKMTIKGVSCESSCLRARIAELEERLDIQRNASCGTKKIVESDELESEHYKDIFAESKRAIKRISEEIENRCKDLESVNHEELLRLTAENKTLREVSFNSQKNVEDGDVMVKYNKANKNIAELQKQLSNCMDDVQRLNAETGALKKISTNDDKYEEQKHINTELQQQLNECKNQVKQLNNTESEVGRLSAENNTLRKLSVDLQNYSNVKVEDVSNRLRKANAQIKDLESDLKIVRDERDQLDKIVRKYKESEILGKPIEFGNECDELMEQLKKCKAELQKEIKCRQERECAYKRSLLDDYANLKAQLETEQRKSADTEAILKQIQQHTSEIDGSDLQRLSKDFENKLNQSALELEVANNVKKQKEKEIQSLHSKFNNSIGKLQSSHEEVLKQVDKEHSKEMNNLRSELKCSKATILELQEKCRCLERQSNVVDSKKVLCKTPKVVSQEASSVRSRVMPCICLRRSVDASVATTSEYMCDCSQQIVNGVSVNIFKNTMDTRSSSSKPTQENISSIVESVSKCTSQFHQILLKIVQFGLESLTFDELKYLHNKTCEAGAVIHKQPMSDKFVPFSTDTISNDSDRQRLIKRITVLENDLIKKQEQTHEKVGALQLSIKMERQRLQHIKTLLNTEKNRNNELMVKIGAQSRAVANMQMERDAMMRKSACNEQILQTLIRQEQMQIQKLEEKLAKEKQAHKREMESLFKPRQEKAGCSYGHGNTNDYEHWNTDSSTFSEPCSQKSHQCKCKSSRSQRQTNMEDID